MAGMRIKRAEVLAALVAAALLLLSGCENDLLNYLFKNLFYSGWKIASWSTPAPVVAGESHTPDPAKSNGYPNSMAMGSNGKLHLIGWRVDSLEWVYTVREPNAETFQQLYTVVASISNPGGPGMPGMDLVSDDAPVITYADTNEDVYYQEYMPGVGWDTPELMYHMPTGTIPHASIYFLTTDFKPHLFFVNGGKLYHGWRQGTNNPEPDSPEQLIADVSSIRGIRHGGSQVIFIYTDAARQNLYYRTYPGSAASTIWSVPDSSLSIGEIALALDSQGAVHICFGTYKTAAQMNIAYWVLHYLRNTGGSWTEMDSITGDSTSAPLCISFPPSINIAKDRNGIERVHLAYCVYQPPFNGYVWYAYYDESGWQTAARSVDTTYSNTGITMPLIAVDPQGIAHIVYSWTVNDNDRTMMYVRGSPAEAQQ